MYSTAIAWSATVSSRAIRPALASSQHGLVQSDGRVLLSLPRGQQHCAERDRRGTGRVRDQAILVEQPRRRGHVARVKVGPGHEAERVLQLHQGARVARDTGLVGGQDVPRVVVPQLAGDDAAGPQADQPEVTADVDIGAGVQREHRLLRAGQ